MIQLKRVLLAEQVTKHLLMRLRTPTWRDWLPPERELADYMRVSRGTLRAALKQLVKSGILRAEHGRGYKIIAQAKRPSKGRANGEVHMLLPEPVGRLRLQSALWIEHLRERLRRSGSELVQHHGERWLGENSVAGVAELVEKYPDSRWVLGQSSRALQTWFYSRRVPCVVAGYPHSGIDLPHVALDQAAAARHAVLLLVRRGHRRIALIAPRSAAAGDIRTVDGFLQGAAESRLTATEARVVHPANRDDVAVCATVDRLFSGAWRPTALFISLPETYATTATWLPRLGCRVPEDVSLVAREHDVLLSHLVPQPCGYSFSATAFAAKLICVIEHLSQAKSNTAAPSFFITPEFQPGASVGRPP